VNALDVLALLPLLGLVVTALVLMLSAACCRNHRLVAFLTLFGLAASLASLPIAWPVTPRQVTPLLLMDHYALFFIGLILAAAFAVTMFSYEYFKRRGTVYWPNNADVTTAVSSERRALARRPERQSVPLQEPEGPPGALARQREEYYVLLVLATAGAAVLVASVHFASFFLGLELLTVALYALVAYTRYNPLSIEAGVKYLVLAGLSSAFLLFGMGLVYAVTGTLAFPALAAAPIQVGAPGVLMLAGMGMIMVGIAFKLSLAPFHLWAADVYQGTPAPAAAFIATVSKGAVFAVLLRYLGPGSTTPGSPLFTVFAGLAVVSMFAGNLLALQQRNLKRLLAFSSIAHMGYLLVAFLAGGPWAAMAVAFYLAAYFITTLGAFGVVSALSTSARDADDMEDYRGLAWRRPWMAGAFSLMLLSLAGIPLTAGFVGKFWVLAAGIRSGLWWLALTLVVNSAIGLFYYLRVLAIMYRPSPDLSGAEQTIDSPPVRESAPSLASVALTVLVIALLWLGLYPAPAIRAIRFLFGA